MTTYRTQINKTQAATLVTSVPMADPLVKAGERIYEGVRAVSAPYPTMRRR